MKISGKLLKEKEHGQSRNEGKERFGGRLTRKVFTISADIIGLGDKRVTRGKGNKSQ